MFVLSRNVSAANRVIATLVATATILGAMGVFNYVQAANVTDVRDLLTDSDRSVVSNHTIQFLPPSGVSAGQSMTVTFPAGFNLSTIVEDDVDVQVNGAQLATAASPSGATWGVSVSGQTLTILSAAGTVGANATVTVRIGTNATSSGTGTHQIVNPGTTGSYRIDIAGTMADSGHTRVAILDNVDVTAKVDTTFTFTVSGVATTTSVNGTTTTRASSSTTIPFGTLVANQITTLAQDLSVVTNAINGFVVTVAEDQHLLSSTGADIDNFANGVESATPASWSAPTNNIAQENTWGHWGVTSQDTATTRSVQFGSNQWVGVSTTPQVLFSHAGPSDGVTAGIGATRVGYQVQISPLQEAGDDYATTLTYIATPTF